MWGQIQQDPPPCRSSSTLSNLQHPLLLPKHEYITSPREWCARQERAEAVENDRSEGGTIHSKGAAAAALQQNSEEEPQGTEPVLSNLRPRYPGTVPTSQWRAARPAPAALSLGTQEDHQLSFIHYCPCPQKRQLQGSQILDRILLGGKNKWVIFMTAFENKTSAL